MKAKNILMSILLVMGSIAAKAAGYPPELALVSQPVMVYNYNSITVYYDVENIGDYTYRGNVYIYLDPDDGYAYAKKYVKVCPGRIKRIAVEIPAYRPNPAFAYTIMPYYELDRELYSFTTFEYFEPLSFYWNGPRTEPWVVINVGPRVRYYRRPGDYRFYYDGFRPPMPPPGHGPGMPPPPMNPMHHTYGYHHNNGGYPATHNEWNNTPPAPSPAEPAPSATVRPKADGGSMSSGNSGNSNPPASNNGGSSSSVNRPKNGRTGNDSGNVSRPNNNGSNSGTSRPSSGSNSNVNRPKSNSRPSGTNSNTNGRTGNSNSKGRVNNSNSSTPRTGTSTSSSSSNRSGSSSTKGSNTSNSRSGSGSGRR